MKKFLCVLTALGMLMTFTVSGAFAAEWAGTHWLPGADTAAANNDAWWGVDTNGDGVSDDWNIPEAGYATWGYTPDLETVLNYDNAVEDLTMALDWWSAVSDFSYGFAGEGVIGDIQVSAYLAPGSTLANAYNPTTQDLLDLIGQAGDGSLGGNIEFATNRVWIDDPNDLAGDNDYDFFTDALHEVGHALGLAHPTDSIPSYMYNWNGVTESIMEQYGPRGSAMNFFTSYDIYLIQTLYGQGNSEYYWGDLGVDDYFDGTWHVAGIEDPDPDPGNGPPVPEPATMLLLGSGLAGLYGFRRRKRNL